MQEKDHYKDLSRQEIKKSMKDEGFDPMLITNPPGFVYSKHTHPETKLLAILDGSMKVKLYEEEFQCTANDQLIIPGNIPHKAVIGDDGCTFYWAEKLIKD